MNSLPYIFGPPTHLHLVLWNRLDSRDHAKAMQAICSLLESDYAKEIMPLIRPIGRARQTYRTFAMDGTFEKVDTVNLDRAPLLDDKHTAHCELWIQTRNPSIDKLEASFGNLDSACFLWERIDPVWQPLGSGMHDCSYATSRDAKLDKLLCTFCDDRIAWIMKLIWHRATVEICALMKRHGGYTPIDPLKKKADIRELMNRICKDIVLKDYGIVHDSTTIDPTDFGVSHMSAFAVNTVTQISNHQVYQLEQYFNNRRVTQPNSMDNRAQFLQLFD